MIIRCPTCRAETEWARNRYRPFCSERCKLLDLGKWLREEYRVSANEDESRVEETAPNSEAELH